jgi:signal transduction protein with GAF and PtsI domain|eukprot:g3323.t1
MGDTQKDIENAAEYLQFHNFKSVMEWITAEMILSRPEDPFQFIQRLMKRTVKARLGDPYNPTDNVDLVRRCYAEAAENADEGGAIPGRQEAAEANDDSDSEDDDFFGAKRGGKKDSSAQQEGVMDKVDRLEKLVESFREFSSTLEPKLSIKTICEQTRKLVSCDRVQMYVIDVNNSILQMHTAEGPQGVQLDMGEGVAGNVAKTGKVMNVKDAYKEKLFNPASDKKSGYVTKTILAVPIPDANGTPVAVIEAINKNGGIPFDKVDTEIMQIMRVHAGASLFNALVHDEMARSKNRMDTMVDVVCVMNKNLGVESIVYTLANNAHGLVGADKSAMYIVDRAANELWTIQGSVNLRFPMDKGVAGYVASKGENINMEDPYNDPRFDQEQDKKNDYKTTSMLALPIFGASLDKEGNQQGAVVGVLQLSNKATGKFDDNDIQFMTKFMAIVGPILEQSSLYEKATGGKEQ